MPSSKTKSKISKLPRDLRSPIDFGPTPPLPSLHDVGSNLDQWHAAGPEGQAHLRALWKQKSDEKFAAWLEERRRFILNEHLRKLQILMGELKIPDAEPAVRMTLLAIQLASMLYPGFSTSDGAKRQGRPRRGERGTDSEDPQVTLITVNMMLKNGMAQTDQEACEKWLQIKDEKLRGVELTRKATSLASVVAATRASARRKAAGEVH